MNLLCFVVLLVFGAIPDAGFNTSSDGEREPTCRITKCVRDKITALIITKSSEMKNMCTELFESDNNVTNVYKSAESIYMDSFYSLFDDTNQTFDLGVFNMTVIKLNTTDLTSAPISAPKLSDDHGDDDADADADDDDDDDDDGMPIVIFIPSDPFWNVSEEQQIIGVVTYYSVQVLIDDLEPSVIHIETVGHETEIVSTRLIINFTMNSSDIIAESHALSCEIYDKTDDVKYGMGYFTYPKNSNENKYYNEHTDPYSVPLDSKTQLDSLQQKIWSGCSNIDYMAENYISYNCTELEFADGLNVSHCNWGESKCYVDCTSVSLTTNITSVNRVMNLVQGGTNTLQNNTQLVFNTSDITITCSITKCESGEMTALISNMDTKSLKKVQKMCNISFSSAEYIRAEKVFIDQQINLEFNGTNKTYENENFKMTVFNITMMKTMNDVRVKMSAPKWSDEDPPIDVFFPDEQFLNVKVGVVTYESSQQFINNSSTVLMSRVIRVETVGHKQISLTKQLVISFPVNSSEINLGNSKPSCQFYNETVYRWDDMGSVTNLENFTSSSTVNCSYDHMTAFGVLQVFVYQQQKHQSCINHKDDITENFFFYNNVVTITENITKVLCKWERSQCYVECSSLNLTTNISNLNNKTLETSNLTMNQNRATFVFTINQQVITCNVTKCVPNEITALINESLNSKDTKDLQRPTQIGIMCNELFASDRSIKKIAIRAQKRDIDFLISLPFNGTDKIYDKGDFSMIVVNMMMAMAANSTIPEHVQISAPKVDVNDRPLDVFVPVEPFRNVTNVLGKVAVVTYRSPDVFQVNNENFRTKVIRVETAGRELKNLLNPLIINFSLSSMEIPETKTLSCQFYDEKESRWNDTGSITNLSNLNSSSNTVTCSCDHMTPFAVLMVDLRNISFQQLSVLSYITYIGCSISSLFSAVTIFLYTFMKSSERDNSLHIHVSLSAAVFLLNTSFLFIDWGATWSQEGLCVLIAVIAQYSLLSCFSWMAIEGVHLYLLLIKVFNTYVKHYMIKLSLFGWGVPAVLVAGSLCVYGRTPFYGIKTIFIENSTVKAQLCWITDTHFLYGMNISYFSLTFLFNSCVLVAVACQIFKMRHLIVRGSKLPSRKDICTILGLTLLLGMTWGLVFFTIGYTNYPILYLFCIFNTLQGLFLFLWFCGAMRMSKRVQTKTLLEMSNSSTQR